MAAMRSSRSTIYVVLGFVFAAILTALAYNHHDEWEAPTASLADDESTMPAAQKPSGPVIHVEEPEEHEEHEGHEEHHDHSATSGKVDALYDFFLSEIQKPSIKPTDSVYQPYGAFSWEAKGEKHWTEPLGQDLCIIDIDNRPFDEPGQAFGHPFMSWDRSHQVHGLSLGALNHWLYAKIHGYKYYFVTFDTPEDRRSSWEKPSIIRKLLQKHKTCVYVDSDAIFFHLDLPFEWLMNYWQIEPKKHSLSLSFDPKFDHNKDKFGKLYLNTGFLVNQNNDKTMELLKDWDECTNDNGKYPGCTDFRFAAFGRPTDQGGFGTYIRYDYKDHIKELPCAEANGFPEDGSECKGTFIRHMWSGKDTLIKIVTGNQIPGKFLEVVHEKFLSEKKDFYMTKAELMAQ